MDFVEVILKSAQGYYDKCHDSVKCCNRFMSWEHCYNEFKKEFKKEFNKGEVISVTPERIDQLALYLAVYLASWGMYRGSSFLLQTDYKVHKPIVELLLSVDNKSFVYKELFGIDWSIQNEEDKNKFLNLLFGSKNCKNDGLIKRIKDHYSEIRSIYTDGDQKSEVSETLITKVLLGTLGCVPAYDTYFREGIGIVNTKYKVELVKSFSRSSIEGLILFYKNNPSFNDAREKMKSLHEEFDYPEMKFLDMGFWGLKEFI